MQNKDTYDIDKTLTNQGWSQMQDILDTEMPQKRHRRLLPFFWIFLIGLCLGFSLFAFWSQSNTHKPIKTTTKQPIANQHIPETLSPSKSNIKQETKEKSTVEVLSIPKSIQKTSLVKNNSASNTITSIYYSGTKETLSERNKSQINNSLEKIVKPNASVTNTLVIPSLKTVQAPEISDFMPLDYLEQLALSSFDLEIAKPKSKAITYLSPNITTAIKKHLLGLQIGVGHDLSAQSNYHIGSFWAYQFKPRWSLETGINCHYFAKAHPITSTNDQQVLANDVPVLAGGSADLPEGEIDTSSPGTTVDSETETITQHNLSDNKTSDILESQSRQALVLPLHINYQFLAKWQIYGGLQVAYFFRIPSSESTFSDDTSFTIQDSNYAPNPKNSFQLWTKAGIRYALAPKWNIGLGYNYSLSSNTSVISNVRDIEKPVRNHFIEMTTRCQF